MKRMTQLLAVSALCAALLCCAPRARAEEWVEPQVTVQLNGKTVTFTDALPILKNDRTFLPFYAVFSALGAEIGFDEPEIGTYVITGRRGDTAISMIADSPVVTLERAGVRTELTMDVAPFIDEATARTYVPVYFAAQALNCDVGWDPYTYTAIIIDTETMVEEAAAGRQYSWLDKLGEFSGQREYRSGIWDVAFRGKGKASLLGATMPMTLTGSGIVEDRDRMETTMELTADMTGFLHLLEWLEGLGQEVPDLADLERFNAMAQDGITLESRGDLAAGTTYLHMTGALPRQDGVEEDVWYSAPLSSTLERMGSPVDWLSASDLEDAILAGDKLAMAKAVLKEVGLTSSRTSYTAGRAAVRRVLAAFSDAGFEREEDALSTSWALQGTDGAQAGLTLTLTTDGEEVTGATLTVTEQVPGDEETPLALSSSLVMEVTGDGTVTGARTLYSAPLLTEEMTYTLTYTPGETAPRTCPPEGAPVKPYEGLIPVKGQGE